MADWLTIKQMSGKYGIAESHLGEWSNLGYITYFTMESEMMLDDESLVQYLNRHKINGLNEHSLARVVEEKELRHKAIFAQLKDELALLKVQSRYSLLFHILIQELGTLIVDDRERGIFLAIASGEPVFRIAQRYDMTYDTVVMVYNSMIDKLDSNPTRIATLRQYATEEPKPMQIHNPVDILLLDIFSYNIWIILSKRGKMRTLYDLLQFATRYGWPELRTIAGIGDNIYESVIHLLCIRAYITIGEDNEIEIKPEIKVFLKK